MSRAAFTAKVFAGYLFLLGPVLMVAPNTLLALFHMAATSEVWIRVIGLLVVNIGVFLWVAARHEYTHFLVASVYSRCAVFLALTAFALLGLASPMIALFGVLDLLGGIWTWRALKADTTRPAAR